MNLFSAHQRRGMVVMLSLLFIALTIFLLAERMQSVEFLVTDEVARTTPLQSFDPNVDDYTTLRQKGLPQDVAVGIIRWRSYGKVYRIKEDLALVTGMTDSLYEVLAPYITIADSVAARPAFRAEETQAAKPLSKENKSQPNITLPDEPFLIDTASAQYRAPRPQHHCDGRRPDSRAGHARRAHGQGGCLLQPDEVSGCIRIAFISFFIIVFII